jgi:DNA helicase-2/ATP-dependent DNA helicase PcrA
MTIDITLERKAYFDARGKIILSACPGSGKTTCLVHKLSLLKKECLDTYGKYSGIACLSFTNNAKDEILDKYRKSYSDQLDYPHLVSTLDSFVNTYITLPFFYLLETGCLRPKIAESAEQIDSICKVYYFKNGKQQEAFSPEIRGFTTTSGTQLARSYAPSSVWIDAAGRYNFKGTVPKNVADADFQAYGAAIMKIKKKKGLISNLDSAFFALTLLSDIPRIGHLLIQRFPYVLIDEAQDNSDIQHEIFNVLVSLGLSNIEMIGDPYQSLYEWRSAKPALFTAKYTAAGWTGLPLNENRRSVQRIIDCFSIMRTAKDPKINSLGVEDKKLPIIVYKYNDTNPKDILEHFEQKCIDHGLLNCHVVVRGNTLKDKMTGNTTDINPWKTFIPVLILKAIFHFQSGHVRNAINEIRAIVTILEHPKLPYNDRQELLNERKTDSNFNSLLLIFFNQLPATSNSLQDWTTLCLKAFTDKFGVDASEAFTFKQRMDGFTMKDLKKEPVDNYFNKPASKKANIPITTVHQVKGSTMDAMLCFFDRVSGKESITFNDFSQTTTFPSEKQRIIYVACSRPQHLLAMAFPDSISDDELKKKFGANILIQPIPDYAIVALTP